jgi:carboxyl-terminal processing protease
VSRFSNKTYKEFMEGMEKLEDKGAKKVIVDLRQNPGGSLSSVLQITDEFLKKGEPILYTEGEHQQRKTYTASDKVSWKNMNVYVLIDEFSASASEIFAGAIQDNDRGLVIGRRSFGKGLVQEQIPLMDGSALRLTVARFYTPSGRCIQKSYEEGKEAYFEDMHERFRHMEQLVADSIHFNDSLKYTTKSGRIVYGGGGIMPDFFIPADTSGNSEYYNRIYRRGLIYNFAYEFADANREKLSVLTSAGEINNYLEKQDILNEFINFAEKEGVNKETGGLDESGIIIKSQLKAYIARNIMGEEGFYPIIEKIDNTLQQAIEISRKNFLVENIKANQADSTLLQLQ